ncbi:MAG TPA: hypothetical protein VMW52_01045 [Phycisphaerae bacterium]|nr:hypothetical protein [Phycisphaerae bacterium]
MANELATVETAAAPLSLMERVADPIAACEKIGNWIAKCGMFGCTRPEQGCVIAMACLVEGKNPIELMREYHLIEGRLTMRADAMLARFGKAGGKWTWLKADDESAKIRLEIGGAKIDVEYTLADANLAGLVKPKSGWVKSPDAMLRARAVSKGIRMIAPQVVVGLYTPEEVADEPVAPAAARRTEALFESPAAPALVPEDKPYVPLADVLAEHGCDEAAAVAFLKSLGWLGEGQPLEDLDAEKKARVYGGIEAFAAKANQFAEAAAGPATN